MYRIKQILWQLLAFVAILFALNGRFRLHISIIGNVMLTIAWSLGFSRFGWQ